MNSLHGGMKFSYSMRPAVDVNALKQAGAQALRHGEARKAREAFEQIALAGLADSATWLALAQACRALNDDADALAAVDRAIELEPRSLRALLFKADHFARAGEARAASSFYLAAVQSAPPPDELPADLQTEIARAQRICENFARQLQLSLQDRLSGRVPTNHRAAARFAQSVDILFGRKRPYFQQPRYYFFPELPQIQFYDRSSFPWLDEIEAATAEIRAELVAVMQQDSAFEPYVQGNSNRPHNEQAGMLDNPDWSAYYLWKNGDIVAEHAARCPKTMAALAYAPITQIANRSPSVLFSLLRPGAHIPPHNGLINTRLICHLPLIVPDSCEFRVGNDARAWVEGKAWVFDDTIEHEAWNRSDQTRVILLFEIWRPELSEEERAAVSALFEAIDTTSGEKPAWEI